MARRLTVMRGRIMTCEGARKERQRGAAPATVAPWSDKGVHGRGADLCGQKSTLTISRCTRRQRNAMYQILCTSSPAPPACRLALGPVGRQRRCQELKRQPSGRPKATCP
uniref:Uncharacterized protein n=1 Tax=Trichuris muris TaxID=70415 RepID=A0A5S6Q755_TRIMR